MLARDAGRRGRRPAASSPARRDRAGRSALAAIWVEPYRRARFFSFLDPWRDAQGAGFQTVQAMIGIGSGGLTGKGLGEGVQKINYLPEAAHGHDLRDRSARSSA